MKEMKKFRLWQNMLCSCGRNKKLIEEKWGLYKLDLNLITIFILVTVNLTVGMHSNL